MASNKGTPADNDSATAGSKDASFESAGQAAISNVDSTWKKTGRLLAKVLDIELEEDVCDPCTRGESVYSTHSDEVAYVETEPTVIDWIKEFWPSARGAWEYFLSFFPFITWITRYNWKWAYGDLVAGNPCSPSGSMLSKALRIVSCCLPMKLGGPYW